MERLKILGVKAFTPMDEKGYYPVGNLRASTLDWRISIAEMEREYVIRLYVAVDKSIIMDKIRKFKIEIDDQQRVNIQDYCEKVLNEYAKGVESEDELFRVIEEVLIRLDKYLVDGSFENKFRRELYRDKYLRLAKGLQHLLAYSDDMVLLVHHITSGMQKREDYNFTRYDGSRIVEVHGSRRVDFEKKNVNDQLKWTPKADFSGKFKGGFKKSQSPLEEE